MDEDYYIAIEHYNGLINELIQKFRELIITHTQNINSSTKNVILSCYSILLFGLLESINILLDKKNFHSITSTTREILECSVILNTFFSLYPNDEEFKLYYQYQNFKDLVQRKKNLMRLVNENDSQNKTSSNEETENLQNNLVDIIKEDFGDFYENVDRNNLPDSLYQTISLIKRSFLPTYDINDEKPKHELVGEMLRNNQAYKKDHSGMEYKNPDAVYGDLCLFSHQNIGAIVDRTLDESGNVLFNKPYRNLPADLTVSYYCALDIFNELKILIS